MPKRPIDSPDASGSLAQNDFADGQDDADAERAHDLADTRAPANAPPAPRGASTFPKTAENQRSSGHSGSECHTTLSYNCAPERELTVSHRSGNRRGDCKTIVRDNRSHGLWRRGSIYYYLKRVPLDLVGMSSSVPVGSFGFVGCHSSDSR